jgi:hypothetical protein
LCDPQAIPGTPVRKETPKRYEVRRAQLDCLPLSECRPLPDDTPSPGVCSSIVLNGEDGREDTIIPRLQALGADLGRVFLLNRRQKNLREPLLFPRDLAILESAVVQTGARPVVIDPIMNFLAPSITTGSDQSVRQALYPLAQLAEDRGFAVQLIRHLNKKAGVQSIYRGGGSIGISAVCRSAWLVAVDPEDSKRCVLAQVKNNYAPPQPSLTYQAQGVPGVPPILAWLGESRWSANQLLAAAARKPPPVPMRERARAFLAEVLKEGPLTLRQIWKLARPAHLRKRTLERAKRDLHVRSVRVRHGAQRLSYWLLPGQQLPADVGPVDPPTDLEEYLAPLREHFPPATPLDDL